MEWRCDALLLDMDGTLVDSTECVERQWRRWAERHGLELEPILKLSHGRTTRRRSEKLRRIWRRKKKSGALMLQRRRTRTV